MFKGTFLARPEYQGYRFDSSALHSLPPQHLWEQMIVIFPHSQKMLLIHHFANLGWWGLLRYVFSHFCKLLQVLWGLTTPSPLIYLWILSPSPLGLVVVWFHVRFQGWVVDAWNEDRVWVSVWMRCTSPVTGPKTVHKAFKRWGGHYVGRHKQLLGKVWVLPQSLPKCQVVFCLSTTQVKSRAGGNVSTADWGRVGGEGLLWKPYFMFCHRSACPRRSSWSRLCQLNSLVYVVLVILGQA